MAIDPFISLATSYDENYPPDNVLDKNESSFWMTTGIFPQILVVSLVQPKKIKKIRILSCDIKILRVETSSHAEVDNFILESEITLPHSDGQLQITELPVKNAHLRHLRLNIRSGYNHFVAVYKVLLSEE
ncbi:Intraflagellar transport protein 25 [Schistosoma japonicum]|uniref:Intraflagellar transport protein 25 n=1 Tax=Schistosoma japonicum TaxID=6182 RepID=C1LDZ0_SCHJA|nr:Intraflagellar transport protein 25 [Schistosoma japonicum]CAX72918.1 Placental protein 25 homolog [Schistosoma japonicum]